MVYFSKKVNGGWKMKLIDWVVAMLLASYILIPFFYHTSSAQELKLDTVSSADYVVSYFKGAGLEVTNLTEKKSNLPPDELNKCVGCDEFEIYEFRDIETAKKYAPCYDQEGVSVEGNIILKATKDEYIEKLNELMN
jgi:hypothetical protein